MGLVMFIPSNYFVITAPIIVLLTCYLILSLNPSDRLYPLLSSGWLQRIGICSYSLYLWHWPILVLFRLTFGLSPTTTPLALGLMSFLAVLTYRFVESPFRRIKTFASNDVVFIGIAYAVLASFSGFIILLSRQSEELFLGRLLALQPPPVNWGLGLACHGLKSKQSLENLLATCLRTQRQSSSERRLFLIGDSHASQFSFMARRALAETNVRLAFLNLDDPNDFPHSFWKHSDATHQSLVLNEILNSARAGDIVVVAFHRGYLNRDRDVHSRRNQMPTQHELILRSLAWRNFNALASLLEDKGVNLLLIRDTPMLLTNDVPVTTCQLQQYFFRKNQCDVSRIQDTATRWGQDLLFSRLKASRPNVYVWDPRDSLLLDGYYYSYRLGDQRFVMRDQNHLTREFSLSLAPQFLVFLLKSHLL
jgi:hypothetical protein